MKDLLDIFGMLLATGIIVLVSVMLSKFRKSKLSINQKKRLLIIHIGFVIVYFGGLLSTLLLVVSTNFTMDRDLIYAAHLFIQYFDNYLVIPGAFGCLFTGVWLAVRSHWGLLKHYWVLAKWFGTMIAIMFGTNLMRIWVHDTFYGIFDSPLNPLSNPEYLHNRKMLLVGLAISFALLISLVTISYFKPWGKRKESKNAS